ncbi:MAG: hypothetical protein OXF49_00785 [Candidatus Saccharibacteria bacterium]|nr:hypothetical protein [Candidatus Saccharibacteria bacterium]
MIGSTKQRPQLRDELHCRKGHYRRTRANKYRVEVRKAMALKRHISNRSRAGDLRLIYGHWEGDTVVGKALKWLHSHFC